MTVNIEYGRELWLVAGPPLDNLESVKSQIRKALPLEREDNITFVALWSMWTAWKYHCSGIEVEFTGDLRWNEECRVWVGRSEPPYYKELCWRPGDKAQVCNGFGGDVETWIYGTGLCER